MKAQTESHPDGSVSQQLEKLAAALRATQQRVEQSQQQIQQMQAEIDRLRELLAAKETPPQQGTVAVTPVVPAAAAGGVEDSAAKSADAEDIDILKSASAQQQQTKVESSSRFPVRLTGLVLFNSFVNQGTVDQIDLPSSALLPSTTSSNTSTGASLRQTILGLEGTGPVLGGAQTSARVSMDFFGGVTGSATSGPAGTVRLRTAAITASWARDTLEANYDTPLISPLSPDSFATVAQPSLAWSGNLWTWAPQFMWKHSFGLENTNRALSFQLGLLDTQTLNAASNVTLRATGAGEASGQPSYETRLAYSSSKNEHHFELGIGGLYGRQNYKGNQRVDTWATTADWRVPFGHRLHLSGELYRGRGLGDLGGGAYRNTVTYNFPNSTATYLRALNAEGGWLEWSYKLSSTLNANASIGQDSASGNELRNSVPLSGASPIFFYTRNRSIVGNLIFRPWSSIILSPEYRRLQSWPILGGVNTANIYTLTFGYQF
ncbi:hypothetical protein [Bryocella elongata]|uniref:hypothetical protein n=1 Tax=Bryocella elongata TaxID=863522 RepID=UPI0011B0B42A|nr:hypothetical protein [Bryocella elongata]